MTVQNWLEVRMSPGRCVLPGGEAEAARGQADVAGEEAVHQQGVSEWLGAGLDEGERHPGVLPGGPEWVVCPLRGRDPGGAQTDSWGRR